MIVYASVHSEMCRINMRDHSEVRVDLVWNPVLCIALDICVCDMPMQPKIKGIL